MKRLMAAMALVMVLVSMFFGSAAAAAQTAVTGLKAMPYSATQVKVSWQGDASVYEVYYKPVEGTFHYYDTVYENSAIISVAPDTDYEIIVKAEEGGGIRARLCHNAQDQLYPRVQLQIQVIRPVFCERGQDPELLGH